MVNLLEALYAITALSFLMVHGCVDTGDEGEYDRIMRAVRKKSDSIPAQPDAVRLDRNSARLVFDAARRAEAMGLVERQAIDHGDLRAARSLARQVDKAGIATSAASALNTVVDPAPEELAALLQTLIAALEASPAPAFEWSGLARVLDDEQLASLLDVSASSLKRYQSGERTTPDLVAARLHFLALVVGDLAGSYNDIGIRRWLSRKRSLLGGRSPEQLLVKNWDPEDAGPRRVRELARELVDLSAT